MAQNYKVIVDGIEAVLDLNETKMEHSLNARPVTTLVVSVKDTDFEPQLESIVKMYNENDELIWDGIVKEASPKSEKRYALTMIGADSELYKMFVDNFKINAGDTYLEVLSRLWTEYLVPRGFGNGILNTPDETTKVKSGGIIHNESIGKVLDFLAAKTNSYWWVGVNRVVNINQVNKWLESPFHLTNDTKDIFNWEVENYQDEYANHIIFEGGEGQGVPWIDTVGEINTPTDYWPKDGELKVDYNSKYLTPFKQVGQISLLEINADTQPADTNLSKAAPVDVDVTGEWSGRYEDGTNGSQTMPTTSHRFLYSEFIGGPGSRLYRGTEYCYSLKTKIEEIENSDGYISDTLYVSHIEFTDIFKTSAGDDDKPGINIWIGDMVEPSGVRYANVEFPYVNKPNFSIETIHFATDGDETSNSNQLIMTKIKSDFKVVLEMTGYYSGLGTYHVSYWGHNEYIPEVQMTFTYKVKKWTQNPSDQSWTYKPIVNTATYSYHDENWTLQDNKVYGPESDINQNYKYKLDYNVKEQINISVENSYEVDRIANIKNIKDGRLQKLIQDTKVTSFDDAAVYVNKYLEYYSNPKKIVKFSSIVHNKLQLGMLFRDVRVYVGNSLIQGDFVITTIDYTISPVGRDGSIKLIAEYTLENNINPASEMALLNKNKPSLNIKEEITDLSLSFTDDLMFEGKYTIESTSGPNLPADDNYPSDDNIPGYKDRELIMGGDDDE